MRISGILAMALISHCIYVQTRESQPLRTSVPTILSPQSTKKNEIRFAYYTYRPAVYPLEVFTQNLLAGEFQNALSRLDFEYAPAQNDSRALEILFENNYVPVWLEVKNTSDQLIYPRNVISLETTNGPIAPIYPAEIPQHFSKLNWKAVAANTYNFTVIVVVLAAMISIGNIPLAGPPAENSKPKIERRELFNPLDISQEIKYETLLFSMDPLKPKQGRAGLVIFKHRTTPDWKTLEVRMDTSQLR